MSTPGRERTGEGEDPVSRRALFQEVIEAHSSMIARIAMVYEKREELRAELIQEIMLALWRALPRYRRESSLKTFVASIAYKRSSTHVARAVRDSAMQPLDSEMTPASGPTPAEAAIALDLRSKLTAAVQNLPLPQREVIVLCLEDFSIQEIAVSLGITRNAAAQRCQRAKSALRALLEGAAGEP